MRRIFHIMILAAALGVMTLGVGGCIFSPDKSGEGGGTTVKYDWPSSEAVLMDNFEKAYENMDFDAYQACLYEGDSAADSYRFKFSQADIIASGNQLPEQLLLSEDLEVQQKMFNGTTSTNEAHLGEYVAEIDVTIMDPDGVTQESDDPDFPDSFKTVYNVDIKFTMSSDAVLQVNSTQEFFFRSKIIEQDDGTSKEAWYIYGQRDPDTAPTS